VSEGNKLPHEAKLVAPSSPLRVTGLVVELVFEQRWLEANCLVVCEVMTARSLWLRGV
jgi:hypothetical protein